MNSEQMVPAAAFSKCTTVLRSNTIDRDQQKSYTELLDHHSAKWLLFHGSSEAHDPTISFKFLILYTLNFRVPFYINKV